MVTSSEKTEALQQIGHMIRHHTVFLKALSSSEVSKSCHDRDQTHCPGLLSAYYNKLLWNGWLKQQAFISHSSEGWQVQDQGSGRFSSH